MIDRRFTARGLKLSGLSTAVAIGCWLSFINSAGADGPALLPPPAPPATPAVPKVEVPSPVLPVLEPIDEPVQESVEGPALPAFDESVEITTPSLDESTQPPALPLLQAPVLQAPVLQSPVLKSPILQAPVLQVPVAKPVDNTKTKAETEDGDTEFVTVRRRGTKAEGKAGNTTASDNPAPVASTDVFGPLLPTHEPSPLPAVPHLKPVNDPYPAGAGENAFSNLQPMETQYSVPHQSTPGELRRLIETMVLTAVPSRHTDDSGWGKRKTITSGVKIGLQGLFLKSERTTKEVDHGAWKKYDLDRKSNSPSYTIDVKTLRMETDKQIRFSAIYRVPVTTLAQQVDFSRGIRLRSLSVGGVATVQLTVDVTVNVEPVARTSAEQPAVVLHPIVNSAILKMDEFQPDNSLRFKGSAGRELARETGRVVKEKLLKQNKGLARSMNAKLATEGYQVATNDLLATKWGKMLASSSNSVVASPKKR